jgi:hypothetical protein
MEALAAEAVGVLGIGPAVDRIGPTLFRQIEDSDTFATTSGESLFLATTLPIANAFIHYATSRDALTRARQWAREHWPDEEDPTAMLAVLTLMHIVSVASKRFENDPVKREVWERIHQRIESVLHGAPRTAAAVA